EMAGVEKTMTVRLAVIADGGTAGGVTVTKTVDYRQSALTAMVSSELPHGNVAFERFTAGGPLALLPSGDELALVWTVDPARAQQLQALSQQAFLTQLRRHFGNRLGAFTAAGPRTLFALSRKCIAGTLRPRTVCIGNAAQTLHPVAGQGFNLGLRDAWELSREIVRWDRDALGDAAMLSAYHARRRVDREGGIWFTDSLVRLFSNDIAPIRAARGIGLTLLGCLPPARNFVVRRMTFGTRG
ncbi:MAG: FAD-dependent monooxygenase, partial [Burkholderiales bacterium]|nr:FAD-dependent monooxygenase [Burkholderiales bacterium]